MTGYLPAFEMTAQVELGAVLDKLTGRDREFAESLLRQAKAYRLSEKQIPWVQKLIDKANGKVPAVPVDPSVLELEKLMDRVPLKDQGFARDIVQSCKQGGATPNRLKWVNTLLDRARAAAEKSETEKLIDQVAEKVGLSKRAIGRVHKRLQKQFQDKEASDLMAVLQDKEALAKVAKEYGDATHNCCFCGLDLTDERSTGAGYGPICAGKYGLPWGDA